ncbi:MAG: T9SS type A sorting domain-containing protein [Saprospiraceae bacterium]|nr:T9SS type A sorting domain-containing protein [Saprospiraceae bacterium]
MKNFTKLLLLLFATVWLADLQAQAFVHAGASGNNDGSSWTNAYVDLQSAIAAAQPGDHIWVAEGTYLPGNAASSTFLIEKDIQLYGGFAGTEINLLQRDWAAHPTILSGDVNGDDIADNFTDNRSDNVNNILHLTTAVTNEMVLDGFVVQGGHADDNSSGAPEALRGGGLWSVGSPALRNCTFRQNYANEGGAGAFFNETPAAVSVQDCIFEANKVKESNFFGGALVMDGSAGVQQMKGCIFQNNFTGSLALVAASGEISECQFLNNNNYGEGAGLLVIQTDGGNVQVKDCQFIGNVSGQLGAGILAVCLEENNHLQVIGCTFEENIVGGLSIGGGMAAIAAGENDNIEISRCVFRGNQADEGGGLLLQATFLGQPAPGATNLNVGIEQCTFEENHAPDLNQNIITGGGGICFLNIPGSQNIHIDIENSQFLSNTSDNLGGGLAIYDEVGNATYSISNCLFNQNLAQNAGGITFINTGQEMAKLNIRSSILESNGGVMTGGLFIQNERPAASFIKDSILIENCLLANNLGGTYAGGISVEAASEVIISESTIADNENGGLKLITAGNAHLRNTILHNPGHDNYSSTGFGTTISSLGGNLSGDQTLEIIFGASDKSGLDPMFLGTGDHPYQLSSSSPAIDAAVPVVNLQSLDLANNARVQGLGMDIGAYESSYTTTSVKAKAQHLTASLSLSPNPASSTVCIGLDGEFSGDVFINILDFNGRIVQQRKLQRVQANTHTVFNIAQYSAGWYQVQVINGKHIEPKWFAKY